MNVLRNWKGNMKLKSNESLDHLVTRLEEHIPQIMHEAIVPGLSIALIHNGEAAWTQGFGVMNTETCQPVKPESVFEGCSLSKPVFAYAALKLCETGRLALDKPLSQYLSGPYVPNEPRAQKITMRQALAHTSGFPNWRPDCWDSEGWNSEGKPLHTYFEPGERFSYSGEGYMYVQHVVEHITGQSGESYMQTELFNPAGMEFSTYLCTSDQAPVMATGHDEHGQLVKKQMYRSMCSAASLHSTPSDVAKILCACMRPGSGASWHINAELAKEMAIAQIPVNDSASWHDNWPDEPVEDDPFVSWGLGWATQNQNGLKAIWHWGDNGPFKAFALGYPEEGTGLVAMANGSNGYKLWSSLCSMALGGEYPCIDWLDRVVNS